jgi:hypothetical protein
MPLELNADTCQRVIAAIDPRLFKRSVQTVLLQEAHHLRGYMVESFRVQKGGGEKGNRPWLPLSPVTIELRRSPARVGGRVGGSKALIATGQMRKSISVVKGKEGEVFVGVPRGAKASGGGEPVRGRTVTVQNVETILRSMQRQAGGDMQIVNIAMLHEYGIVMRWTVKQRRWFFAQLNKARSKKKRRPKEGGSSGSLESDMGRLAGGALSMLIVPARPFIGPSIDVWMGEGPQRMQASFDAAYKTLTDQAIARKAASAAKKAGA